MFAEDEAELLLAAATSPSDLDRLVAGRTAGVPLEHLLGWARFAGLAIVVEPGVFVPRRRTELLARQALTVTGRGDVVVDLCCGSGAVGAALAAGAPGIELHAADVDAAAVRSARRNLPHAQVHQGDLYDALPRRLRGRVTVLVANAPYVPTRAIDLLPHEARVHEPRAALDGGPDGLDVQRRVAAGAVPWLAPGGHLLVETSEVQAASTAELFGSQGLVPTVVRDEELDATVVAGSTPPD